MSKKWTTEEVTVLKNEYETCEPWELLELLPDRTMSAIDAKARRLGLISEHKRTRPHSWRNLNDSDIQLINDNIDKPAGWIHKNLLPGVSYRIIREYMLEINGDTLHWSQEELNIIRDNFEIMHMDALKVLLPNRTIYAISRQAYKMGLRKKDIRGKKRLYNLWTLEEDTILKTYYGRVPVDKIAELLNGKHTMQAIIQRIPKVLNQEGESL